MDESKWRLITVKQAKREQQYFSPGYEQCIEADRPNREAIMLPVKTIMRTWFEEGVKYGRDIQRVLPRDIRPYINMPNTLQDAWELAATTIKRNILKQRGIPITVWPDLIFRIRAVPLDVVERECPKIGRRLKRGRKRELKADCGIDTWIRVPPFGTIYETEHLPPGERADRVGDRWYGLEFYCQYVDIISVYTEEGWQWGPNPYYGSFTQEYERHDEKARKLSQSGLSEDDQFIYACCRNRKGFEYEEIKEALRHIGSHKSMDELKKWLGKHEEKLIELGFLKRQWPACQDPRTNKL
jgi:hypothetical protein